MSENGHKLTARPRQSPPTGRIAVKPRRQLVALSFVAILGLAMPASAHHGWGNYDSTQTLTLTGKIVESSYQNPHGMLRLEVPGKIWHVVLAPPSRMQNRGLAPEQLTVGKSVTAVGYSHRSEAAELRAERIIVDGQTVELR